MKFATPINRAIVYNPQSGRNLPNDGDYVTMDQHFVRREKEGTVKITNRRPSSSESVKPSTPKKKDGK